MKKLNTYPTKLTLGLVSCFGLSFMSNMAWAACSEVSSTEARCDDTSYYNSGLNLESYEHLIIETTTQGGTTPLTGFGMYFNGNGTLNYNQVTIDTQGAQADAIIVRGNQQGRIISFGDGLNITTNGSSSDGINVAEEASAARVQVGNDARIINHGTGSGIGVRVNNSRNSGTVNVANVADRLYVETFGSGSNLIDGVGYGLYAGMRSWNAGQQFGTSQLTVGSQSTIITHGNSAHAVFANKGGVIQLGDHATISTEKNNAYGIHALTGSSGGVNQGGGVYFLGGASITSPVTAIYASGANSKIASYNIDTQTSTAGVFQVNGDIKAANAGQIDLNAIGASQFNSNVNATGANSLITLNLAGASEIIGDHLAGNSGTINLNYNGSSIGNGDMVANTAGAINLTMGQNSRVNGNMTTDGTGAITAQLDGNAYYTGTVDASAGGPVTMNIMSNGAKWQMLNTSNITNLNVSNGGEVILGDANNPDVTNRVDLNINNLSGNGRFYVRADINRDGLTTINDGDKIYITDSSTGSHTVYVRDANLGNAAVSTTGTELLRIVEDHSGGDATFTLGGDAGTGVQQAYVDVGAYRYTLNREDLITRAPGPVYWSLSAAQPGPGPGPAPILPPLTNLAQNAAGLLNINYLLGYVETQTLLQRMGELRDSNSYGDVWGRVYTGKLSSFDNPRLSAWNMDYYGVQVGVDRRLDVTDGSLYVGAMAGTGKGDTDYVVGSGDTKSYHVGIYGTYQMDNGFYLDGILKYTYMRNNINTLTGGGYAVSGHGSSQGFSIGVEGGKRFYVVEPDQGWYVEPQAQLTYSHQDDATIDGSNGLRTDLEGYSSVLGRISVIVGYEITQGPNPINLYLKTGYVREFDGKTGYTFNYVNRERYDFGGGWWDNGIGINTQIGERHNLYMDATYSRGGSFDRKQFNIGYRYSF